MIYKTCVITLRMYAQQGYTFGRVGLYSVCQQKTGYLVPHLSALPLENLLLNVF